MHHTAAHYGITSSHPSTSHHQSSHISTSHKAHSDMVLEARCVLAAWHHRTLPTLPTLRHAHCVHHPISTPPSTIPPGTRVLQPGVRPPAAPLSAAQPQSPLTGRAPGGHLQRQLGCCGSWPRAAPRWRPGSLGACRLQAVAQASTQGCCVDVVVLMLLCMRVPDHTR